MKKVIRAGVSLIALVASSAAMAADLVVKAPIPSTPYGWDAPPPYPKDWDKRIGDDVWSRFVNYYALEWGHDGAPPDPTAPPPRRPGWTPAPQTTPPYPYTEWPYGGATSLGVTRPNSVDSPLMVALANTEFGKALNAAHVQIYGWINVGGNISTNTVKPGGNWPAAYMYTPNTVQLDQAVVYFERLPDTVQKDHIDWGFRVSALYGENYRYTTAYGLASWQLLNHNLVNGYDLPMVYGELYIPYVAEGLLLRFGRFISLPDIEAQLAPNNYMYSHSMAYSFDNYTNTGLQATLALTKNWFVQLGVTVGTEAMPWHVGQKIPNPFPNPVFPGTTMPTDPGAKPSITGCVRYQTDTAHDSVYVCADAINDGTWGYNNLQWYGLTWYHKFNEQWNVSFEAYTLSQRNVLNITDPAGIIAAGGYPFAPGIIQCAELREVQRSHGDHMHGAGGHRSGLLELSAIGIGQHFTSHRILSRRAGPANHRRDPLCRHWAWLAALVLAASRDSSGNHLLQVVQRAGVQRQFQRNADPDSSEQILHVVVRGRRDLAFLIEHSKTAGEPPFMRFL